MEEPCAICLDKITNVYKTTCYHSFCSDCVILWLNKAGTCPICRKQLNTVLYIYGTNIFSAIVVLFTMSSIIFYIANTYDFDDFMIHKIFIIYNCVLVALCTTCYIYEKYITMKLLYNLGFINQHNNGCSLNNIECSIFIIISVVLLVTVGWIIGYYLSNFVGLKIVVICITLFRTTYQLFKTFHR